MSPARLVWRDLADRVMAADHLLVFLDYDGTLVPLADHPTKATLSGAVRRTVAQLAACPGVWVALVSGRALRDLKRLVNLPSICYVGNHGLELEGPRLRYTNPMAAQARPVLTRIRRQLEQVVSDLPGTWVEDKGLTLTVHYRTADVPDRIRARQRVTDVVSPYQAEGRIRVTTGKCVVEIRPPVHWTKGTIVRWLLARWVAVVGAADVLPIYVGDDVTDEDAFAAIRAHGVTVVVGPPAGDTRAQFVLRNPREVHRLLQHLIAWGRRRPVHAA